MLVISRDIPQGKTVQNCPTVELELTSPVSYTHLINYKHQYINHYSTYIPHIYCVNINTYQILHYINS